MGNSRSLQMVLQISRAEESLSG